MRSSTNATTVAVAKITGERKRDKSSRERDIPHSGVFVFNVSSVWTVAVANITGERGWRVAKKVSLRRFSADQKIASSWEKMCFGASYSTSNKLLLVARHILTTGLQKCL